MTIITGTIAYDYIMNFPGLYADHIYPDKIHQINLSFIVDKFAKRRGGTAGNISYSLNLLNTKHILLAAAGQDFTDYKKHFEDVGISTKDVKIIENEYTASGFAMTDKNNNQIWGYFYGAAEYSNTLLLSSVKGKKDLVLVGPCGSKGSMHMVKECVDNKTPYMFDPGFILTQVTDEDLEFGVKHATYLIGNDYEIESIQKRLKNYKTLIKDKIVITTLGKEGAEIFDKGNVFKIVASEPTQVVDPTGAGDAWRSGFVAGLERGFDLKTCAQMGSVAASYPVEQYGSQEHTYTPEQFKNRYRQTYDSLVEL